MQSSSSKIHPTLSLQDKRSGLSACFREDSGSPFEDSPARQTALLFWLAIRESFYSASLANDTSDSFSVRWEFEKCPPWGFFFVVVAAAAAVTVKQIMTATKEPSILNNEAVKTNV